MKNCKGDRSSFIHLQHPASHKPDNAPLYSQEFEAPVVSSETLEHWSFRCLRRRSAAEAGKKEGVTFSLFMEVNKLEVEEDLSTMAALFWVWKVFGWEDGKDSSRSHGRSRPLKYTHGDR